MYLLPNFDVRKTDVCFDVFLDAILFESWCKSEVLIFMCFWKKKKKDISSQ